MLKFELVVPAYNECASLETLIASTIAAAKQSGFDPATFQLIIVNNGSTDETESFLNSREESPERQWYRIVSEKPNRGYGAGVYAGLLNTTAPIVGYTHADLQCDPQDAFRAYAICAKGKGNTFVRSQRTGRDLKDKFVSQVFAVLVRQLLHFDSDEINAQPKIFPRELMQTFVEPPKDFAFDLFVLYQAAKADYRFETISVAFPPRLNGVSKWASTLASRRRTITKMIKYIGILRRKYGVIR